MVSATEQANAIPRPKPSAAMATPTAATGMGVFTWPPAGEARGTLTVTPDVAKSS